ncbi:hypothetical protein INS49_007321 [Diaporthe citri]|uniref:uncharacterized protein n=1 Tax=Diaporthe citri TaxID=83186 RepID=UPI001C80301A|nr:uncharacterized protein INS49_007321 [Diaporthe citri]KAG6365710.1 hypothetical protein INS49_007321 [Diaporthe citri]
MVKDDKDVIAEFNEYVNMTASELEKWLKSEESSEAGWRKDGGDGKSVGQESGEKIIEILKANPKKDPEKYTEDQIQHMRKVASYCKRHLAQESASLEEKDPEDAKKTKSYISLKNWGHDPLKGQGGNKASGKNGSKSSSKEKVEDDEQEDQDQKGEEGEEGNGEEAEEDEKKAGDKRKKSGQQNGSNKKRETRQGASSKKNGEDGADQDEEDAEEDGENGEQEGEDGGDESGGKKPSKNGPKKGETVSWNWGSGNPEGKVLDVKEDEATITTKRGNEVTRKGDAEDPAVILDTGKSKAIKSAHELN